jgi:pyruvate kinase
MSAIAVSTESAWFNCELHGPPPLTPFKEIEATVAYGSYMVADTLSARAIVAFTTSGATARRVACHRPVRPVLALTAYPQTQRWLALSWGVESALTDIIKDTDEMIRVGLEKAQTCGIAAPEDLVVVIAGTPPYGRSGRTNTLKVERIPQPGAGVDQGD